MTYKISSNTWSLLKIIFVLFIITGSVFLFIAFYRNYRLESSKVSKPTVDDPNLRKNSVSEGQRVDEHTVDDPNLRKNSESEGQRVDEHTVDAPKSSRRVESDGETASKPTVDDPNLRKNSESEGQRVDEHTVDDPKSSRRVESDGETASEHTVIGPKSSRNSEFERQEASDHTVDAPKFCTDMSYFDSFIQCLVPFKTVLYDLNGKTVDYLKECLKNIEEGNSVTKNHPIFARIIKESQNQIEFIESCQLNEFEKLCNTLMIKFIPECDLKKLGTNISWTSLEALIFISSFIQEIELSFDNFSAKYIKKITIHENPMPINVTGPKLGIFSLQLNQEEIKASSKDIKIVLNELLMLNIKYGIYELKSFAVYSRNSSDGANCVAYKKESENWYNISGDKSVLDNNFDLVSNLPLMLFYMRVGD